MEDHDHRVPITPGFGVQMPSHNQRSSSLSDCAAESTHIETGDLPFNTGLEEIEIRNSPSEPVGLGVQVPSHRLSVDFTKRTMTGTIKSGIADLPPSSITTKPNRPERMVSSDGQVASARSQVCKKIKHKMINCLCTSSPGQACSKSLDTPRPTMVNLNDQIDEVMHLYNIVCSKRSDSDIFL
ncbi:hypothetical protein MBLNU459_g3699t1 [Dothideomycetes sp. NU459]